MLNPRAERLQRLTTIPDDDDQIDPELEGVGLRYDQSRKIADHEMKARLPIALLLQQEVQRCEERLEAARRDLRHWLLSHSESEPS